MADQLFILARFHLHCFTAFLISLPRCGLRPDFPAAKTRFLLSRAHGFLRVGGEHVGWVVSLCVGVGNVAYDIEPETSLPEVQFDSPGVPDDPDGAVDDVLKYGF